MKKRVGITHDLEERKKYWEREFPIRNWQVVARGLTYDEAQSKEKEYIDRGYEGSLGGEKKHGSAYSVYTFEY